MMHHKNLRPTSVCMCVRACVVCVCVYVIVWLLNDDDNYTVQLHSNLTLECVSLASARKASNVTREIVASARTGLANWEAIYSHHLMPHIRKLVYLLL